MGYMRVFYNRPKVIFYLLKGDYEVLECRVLGLGMTYRRFGGKEGMQNEL